MGLTLTEKIISNHMGREVHAGETVILNVDFAGLHDGSGPLFVRLLNERGYQNRPLFDPNRILMGSEVGPHPDRDTANEDALDRNYAREHKCHWAEGGCGHIHAHIYEEYLKCGDVCIVGDSHTTVHGAFGAFATGCGSTDMAAIMLYGKTWIKVPETFRINVDGELQKGVYSKDIVFKVASIIKSDQAIYKALEYRGSTLASLSQDARLTLTVMGVDLGAKNAIMETDEKTREFLKKYGREDAYREIKGDEDANYARVINIDGSKIEPMVAKPHNVENVDLVKNCKNQKVDMIFLGSCTNGRAEDLRIAAQILKGKHIASSLRMIVIPNSGSAYRELMQDGTLMTLYDAGCMVESPDCGPCMGTHKGIPADNEVVVATQNRNFKGRMGNPTASIYLSSPATAAATALTGYLTDPREVM